MNITQAIKTAAKQVTIIPMGRGQYQVNHWSITHKAWWMGNPTNRQSALRMAHEYRVERALELLGFGPEYAYGVASSCTYNTYPKDWRQCVREIKAQSNAQ